MFEFLRGKVRSKKADYIALDVNGVGYRVYITLKSYEKIVVGQEIEMYIHSIIKEDSFKLVGFLEERERTMFELFIGISGIGMSLALSIMSSFSIDNIREIVLTEDFKKLKKVPKLGEKKSKQIIIDLNNKMKQLNLMSMEEPQGEEVNLIIEDELYLALESLGYSKKEIESLVSKEDIIRYTSLEEAIRGVLKKIQMRS